MAADLLIHAGEDLLLPGLVPGDANAPIGFGERRFEEDGSACVVLPHDQVQHGMVHGAVGIVARIERIEVAIEPVALRVLISRDGVHSPNQAERGLGGVDVSSWKGEVLNGDALGFGETVGVTHQANNVGSGRGGIAGGGMLAGEIAEDVGLVIAVVSESEEIAVAIEFGAERGRNGQPVRFGTQQDFGAVQRPGREHDLARVQREILVVG